MTTPSAHQTSAPAPARPEPANVVCPRAGRGPGSGLTSSLNVQVAGDDARRAPRWACRRVTGQLCPSFRDGHSAKTVPPTRRWGRVEITSRRALWDDFCSATQPGAPGLLRPRDRVVKRASSAGVMSRKPMGFSGSSRRAGPRAPDRVRSATPGSALLGPRSPVRRSPGQREHIGP